MKIAFIGYGAVASVHARVLAGHHDVILAAVFGPNGHGMEKFARDYPGMKAAKTIEDAISEADLAIVSSPSPLHFEQGLQCLASGLNTLLEMPPCETVSEAVKLGAFAEENQAMLQCAHTSRYLEAHRRVTECLRERILGEIRSVSYSRHLPPRKRGWEDDALLHHSAHPLDLFFCWFGSFQPKGCVVLPDKGRPQSVSMLAELPNGAPASISVVYSSHLPQTRLTIVGEHHSVETDGFSYIRSDLEELNLTVSEITTYEQAIREQDLAFVHACSTGKQEIVWQQTVQLMGALNAFQSLL